jgi:hypothetical protein
MTLLTHCQNANTSRGINYLMIHWHHVARLRKHATFFCPCVPRLFEKFNESHKSEFLITKQLFISREKFFGSRCLESGD